MPDEALPIFVTATLAKVPRSWTPCGAVVKLENDARVWLLVAPLWRVSEMQTLIAQGA